MKTCRCFWPLTLPWAAVLAGRHWLYDKGWLKSYRFDFPVIAVGNLNMGGAGKTPVTEYIVDLLLRHGKKTAVVSRGYKRRTRGFLLAKPSHTPADIGDEPYQIFGKFHTNPRFCLAVGGDRVDAIRRIHGHCRPDVVVLDDAFQHRRLAAGMNILLTPYHRPFYADALFPAGTLRDLKSRARHADMAVITKTPVPRPPAAESIQKRVETYLQPVYFSSYEYGKPTGIGHTLTWEELRGRRLLVVTGIADPGPLYDELSRKKLNFVKFALPDHAHYSRDTVKKIRQKAMDEHAEFILTTEKDFPKLQPRLGQPVYYIPLRVRMHDEEFDKKILTYVNTGKSI